MRKLFGLLFCAVFCLLFLGQMALAAPNDIAAKREAQLRLRARIVKYTEVLQKKLAAAKTPAQKAKIQKDLAYQKKRIQIVNERLRKLTIALPTEVLTVPSATREAKQKSIHYEVGGGVGFYAGSLAARGELSIKINPSFDVRVGAAYAQGDNTNPDTGAAITRKYAFSFADAVFRVRQEGGAVSSLYLGAGVNYLNYTSGQYHGEIGYEGFLGFEKEMGSGMGYVELGYGTIRTGFTADRTGINALAGYKIPIRF